MEKSIAQKYIASYEGNSSKINIDIDDVVLQSKDKSVYFFTDGSLLKINENENEFRDLKPRLELEVFLDDGNDIGETSITIIKNQYVTGDDFMSFAISVDSDLNGYISYNNSGEKGVKELSKKEMQENLVSLNIDPSEIQNGLKEYINSQNIVKDKYNDIMSRFTNKTDINSIEPQDPSVTTEFDKIMKKAIKKTNNRRKNKPN